jgi:uncharacterized protein (DUF2267 family)
LAFLAPLAGVIVTAAVPLPPVPADVPPLCPLELCPLVVAPPVPEHAAISSASAETAMPAGPRRHRLGTVSLRRIDILLQPACEVTFPWQPPLVTPEAARILPRRTLADMPRKGAVAMDVTELARDVAERTGLSREESADIARAVLEGVSDQLSEGEARHLAAEVPEPLAAEMAARRRHREEAHPISVDDFVRQVSARTGQPDREARAGVGAVLGTLRETLSDENYGHLMGQLPAAYAELAQAVG